MASNPLPPYLYTPRLRLERWDDTDEQYACILATVNGKQALEMQGDFGIRTPAEFRRFLVPFRIRHVASQPALARVDVGYMLRARDGSGPLLGCVSLAERTVGEEAIAPDIGWGVLEGEMGKGYATEAATEVLRFLREDLGIKDISVFVNERNVPSNRVAEKLGFTDGGQVFVKDEGMMAPVWVLPHMEKISAKGELDFAGTVERYWRDHPEGDA